MPCVNNKGADQPAHLRRLISTFVVRCLDSIISLVSMAAQAGLGLTWSKTPKTCFLVTRLISYLSSETDLYLGDLTENARNL